MGKKPAAPIAPTGWHRAQGCSRAIFITLMVLVILSMILTTIQWG